MNSFRDALAPLAARMPRVVREQEVLRVAAVIPGDEPEAAARAAAAEVLKWARNQAGMQLPPLAWDGESFDLPLPGRDPSAIRLRTAESDVWAFRMHRPDRDVPGRAWTTEVVLGHLPRQPARFSTRLLVATDETELAIEPAAPGFVRQIAIQCGLMVGSQMARTDPVVLNTSDHGDELVDHLLEQGRLLPTIVLTCPDGDDAPLLDAAQLNGLLLGLAHVVVASPDACWRLTERFGKRLSVFGGALRVYLPGFDEADDPFSHRLVLRDAMESAEGASRVQRWLREAVAQASLRRTRIGRDVLSFAAIRSASLEVRLTSLSKGSASETDQLAATKAQVEALQEQLKKLEEEKTYYLDEYAKERERAETAEARAQKAAWRIQQLTVQLRKSGADPDEAVQLPTTWAEFADWSDEQLAGRLILTPSARRGVRKPVYESVETAARCLLWLATEGRDRFLNGGGTLSNIAVLDGIQNAPCGADTYGFHWSGRIHAADWHIKNGGNRRDPVRCLRIYYGFDPQSQQIIMSDLPAHRHTGAT
jgi:cell division protein FtsB